MGCYFTPGSESDFLRPQTDARSSPLANRRRPWARLYHCNQEIRATHRYYDSGDVSKTCESCVVLFTWSKTLQQLVRLLLTMCGSLRKGISLGLDSLQRVMIITEENPEFTHGSSLSRRDRITNLKTSSQIISIRFWEGLISLWFSCNIQLARNWVRIGVFYKVLLEVVYL